MPSRENLALHYIITNFWRRTLVEGNIKVPTHRQWRGLLCNRITIVVKVGSWRVRVPRPIMADIDEVDTGADIFGTNVQLTGKRQDLDLPP